jgi:hypothetical protein
MITDPSPVQTAVTWIEVPAEDVGVNTHPVAVPTFVRSLLASPEIDSEKSIVNPRFNEVDRT